jgi:hypothetical protein
LISAAFPLLKGLKGGGRWPFLRVVMRTDQSDPKQEMSRVAFDADEIVG